MTIDGGPRRVRASWRPRHSCPSTPVRHRRRIQNGLIDRRPALIARCHGTADVQAAVRFGREQGLEIAIRAAGTALPATPWAMAAS